MFVGLAVLACLHVVFGTRSQPHIIVIMADDLGWNDVGYHGSEIRTPNIDALAASGVKLSNHYTAPNCGPSRAQFLTGKYVTHLGLQHKNIGPCRPHGIPLSESTLADELAKLGYRNHLIGKWHGGYHTREYLPTSRGFHTFRGMHRGQGDHFSHSSEQVLDFFNDTTPYPGAAGVYSTDYYKNRALELIDEHNKTGDPMFMFLSLQAPHTPNQAPIAYREQYTNIGDTTRQLYAAMVSAMDGAIGEIVLDLHNKGMYDNTVIMFMSDNGGQALSGGASNFPLRGNKGTYYEAGIKTVAFVTSPLLQLYGDTDHNLIHVTDWMPTFIRLAGGTPSTDLDGVDQWDTLSRGMASSRIEIIYTIDPLSISDKQLKKTRKQNAARLHVNDFYSDYYSDGITGEVSTTPIPIEALVPQYSTDQLSVIRWGNMKMMTGEIGFSRIIPSPVDNIKGYKNAWNKKNFRTIIRLYNISADPSESTNLAASYPDIVTLLTKKLTTHQKTATPVWYPQSSWQCEPQRYNGGLRAWGPYLEVPTLGSALPILDTVTEQLPITGTPATAPPAPPAPHVTEPITQPTQAMQTDVPISNTETPPLPNSDSDISDSPASTTVPELQISDTSTTVLSQRGSQSTSIPSFASPNWSPIQQFGNFDGGIF